MTHIVTGGAGFVGSHLVDALVTQGDRVKVIDNFSRGSIENLGGVVGSKLFYFKTSNLEYDAPPIGRLDTLWHLAAKVAGIEYNRKNQYEMLRSNLAINKTVIDAVRRAKPRLFVYASTVCVYPADAPVPTPESAGDICNPEPTNHGYAIAKWVGEQMVRHLKKEHGIPCIIVRFNNSAGPRDYYDTESSHVIPALIRRVMEGENPLVVWGSGQQTRSFVDVRDIAQALIMLAATPEAHDACPINVGSECEISIADLVEMIVGKCGIDVGYEFDTSKPDGHKRRASDVSKLRELIGWVPDTSLDKTAEDMVIEYMKGESRL